MPRPSPLPPPLPHQPFAVKTALKLNVSPARLRASDLSRPFHGVRAPVRLHQLSTVESAIAYSTCMPAGQFFSHLTAAELLGMRLPEGRRSGNLHVAARDRAPRSRRVVGHELATSHIVTLANGLRVTSVIDTWCDLACMLTVDDLVIIGDGIVRRLNPSASVEQLTSAVAKRGGHRGLPKLRAALQLIRPNTDSARETMLRLMVVRAGFAEPVLNPPITNQYGAVIAHGDLTWLAQKVILEYDGRQHWEDDQQFAIDIRRLDDLMDEAWRVIRVDKALMRQPAVLFGKLAAALERDG